MDLMLVRIVYEFNCSINFIFIDFYATYNLFLLLENDVSFILNMSTF